VVPSAVRISRVSARAVASSSHAKLTRRASAKSSQAARQTLANTPARRVHASAYRTASLASKHHAAAN
jgi:hypothetical protein